MKHMYTLGSDVLFTYNHNNLICTFAYKVLSFAVSAN